MKTGARRPERESRTAGRDVRHARVEATTHTGCQRLAGGKRRFLTPGARIRRPTGARERTSGSYAKETAIFRIVRGFFDKLRSGFSRIRATLRMVLVGGPVMRVPLRGDCTGGRLCSCPTYFRTDDDSHASAARLDRRGRAVVARGAPPRSAINRGHHGGYALWKWSFTHRDSVEWVAAPRRSARALRQRAPQACGTARMCHSGSGATRSSQARSSGTCMSTEPRQRRSR
jgi:hypothetical protein